MSLFKLFYTLDIDECDTSNGRCNHVCTNTNGSYECTCDVGYSLNEDSHTCSGNNAILTVILTESCYRKIFNNSRILLCKHLF